MISLGSPMQTNNPMRISINLFPPRSTERDDDLEFSKDLEEFFVQKGYEVKRRLTPVVSNNSPNYHQLQSGLTNLSSGQAMEVNILQHPFSPGVILSGFEDTDTPTVHIVRVPSERNHIPCHKNLWKVLCFGDHHSLPDWGIPADFVESISAKPSNQVSFDISSEPSTNNVLCIIGFVEQGLYVARSIIATANWMAEHKFRIIFPGSSEDLLFLRRLANSNVEIFPNRECIERLIDEAFVVIANGQDVPRMVGRGKKVLVAGLRGFGGLVDKDSYEVLHRFDFQGRPGAGLIEEISPSLLAQEIRYLTQVTINRCNATGTTAGFRYDKYLIQCFTTIEETVVMAARKTILLHHNTDWVGLKPRRAINCTIGKTKNNKYALLRSSMYSVLAILEDDIAHIVSQLDGIRTIEEIATTNNLTNPEDLNVLHDNMLTLWHLKSIVI